MIDLLPEPPAALRDPADLARRLMRTADPAARRLAVQACEALLVRDDAGIRAVWAAWAPEDRLGRSLRADAERRLQALRPQAAPMPEPASGMPPPAAF